MNLPAEHIAGDTLSFRETLAEYSPADGWAATLYVLGDNKFSYAGTADGGDFTWTIAASVTSAWPPGVYQTKVRVVKGAESYTLLTRRLVILYNPAQPGAGFDPRSHLERVVETLEGLIEGRLTADYAQSAIGGFLNRQIELLDPTELRVLYWRYKKDLDAERELEGINAGTGKGKKITSRISNGLW